MSMSLLQHCHKKPKYQGFDYCGKNCAALANNAGKPRNAGAAAGVAAQAQPKVPTYPKSNNSNPPKAATPAIDPFQIASAHYNRNLYRTFD